MMLEDRVAIVTGASRGIGAATAVRYARAGAGVVVNFVRSAAAADSIVDRIRADGGRAVAVRADVADPDAVAAMAASTRDKFEGRIDVLVNNAATGFIGGRVGDADWEAFATSWEVMVRGAFNCCQAVLPAMVGQRYGRIINVGSTSVWELNEAHAPYITAKGALMTMTTALARAP